MYTCVYINNIIYIVYTVIIYIYTYILYIYAYMCVVCVYIYIYIYVYIHTHNSAGARVIYSSLYLCISSYLLLISFV